MEKIPEEGFLYVIYGSKLEVEFQNSVDSLKRCMPDAHVTVITNSSTQYQFVDHQIRLPLDETDKTKALAFKPRALLLSPYQQTYYIDTDTYFCDETRELFSLLKWFDLIVTHANMDKIRAQIPGVKMEAYHCYNGGFLVFNSGSRIKDLFQKWVLYTDQIQEPPYSDQPTLMKSIFESDCKIYCTSNIYNLRTPYIQAVGPYKVKMLHGRDHDLGRISKTINKNFVNRVWLPNVEKMINRGVLNRKGRLWYWILKYFKK